MNASIALDWFRHMLFTAVVSAAPILTAAVALGLTMAILQAATQVNDASVAYVPKAIAAVVALTVAGPWILAQVTRFASEAFTAMGRIHP